MSIEKFVEALKQDDVLTAYTIIKEELSSRARVVTEQTQFEVAESFKMTRIVEKKDEDEQEEDDKKKDDNKENEDDGKTEEEKEQERAKKEQEGK